MIRTKYFTFFNLLVVAVLIAPLHSDSAPKWNVVKSHSQIRFSINHFFTPVEGWFEKFDIDLYFDAGNVKESSIDVKIQINSINTGNEKRDADLRSANFFDAEKYPEATFKSKEIVSKSENNFVAKGTLTIKDVVKEIELPFSVLGMKEFSEDEQKKMRGTKRIAGFSASYTINRHDFGIGLGKWLSDLVLGSDVKISITLETKM
jgi:polyisoprenoid-binding protein YceI